ncbi:hypothetical protein Scep_019265 [Stephania cephalantha]|uniref:Uncharacterized protein n=1 Tax=Stephania cephalantha TaxID=152367 RepID=A0AAP0NPP1_9MAGN
MGESSPTDMNGEYSSPPNPQPLGLQVVGIWIIPTLIGAISYITQVAIGNQHAKPKQKLILSIFSGVALATCVVGDDMKPHKVAVNVLNILCKVIPTWKIVPTQDVIDAAIKEPERRGGSSKPILLQGEASIEDCLQTS